MRLARKARLPNWRHQCTLWIFLGLALGCAASLEAAPPSPLDPLVRKVQQQVDPSRAMETVRRVYATDRWFTFPKFEETAAYLQQRLRESGLQQVEIGGAAADGKTQAGFWTMPLAWDARSARLEMIEPEHAVLCDYQRVPASLGMWSGATPRDGVTAELVSVNKAPWPDVRGKLVLTDRMSAGSKQDLVKNGALGAVNGFSENPELRDERQWVNAWGDNGWGFTKASTPLLSFSVTPRQADHLRSLLSAGKKVVVKAVADTRFYEGRYPWVTGVLPGTGPEEVLVLGHTSEQGAQDNATGVASMVEALHTLSRLVQSGQLPRPQRGIRVLLMPELYGSLSYLTQHEERMRRTVAAMTVDTPAASYDLAGTEYTWYLNPHVAMSYTDSLAQRIAQACLPSARAWHVKEHMTGTDAYLGEPMVGVPNVWPYSGTGVVTHHNSADKPETVDARSLRDLASMIATYLYYTATAGEAQTPWLAEGTVDRTLQQMQAATATALDGLAAGNAVAGSYGLQRLGYLAERGEQAALSVLRLVAPDRQAAVRSSLVPLAKRLREFLDLQQARLRDAGAKDVPPKRDPQAAAMVVHRLRPGSLPLDDLPEDQREGFPSGAWDKAVTVALYWCDGKRNLADVIHLTEMEVGPVSLDFVGYFRFLAKHGYVKLSAAPCEGKCG